MHSHGINSRRWCIIIAVLIHSNWLDFEGTTGPIMFRTMLWLAGGHPSVRRERAARMRTVTSIFRQPKYICIWKSFVASTDSRLWWAWFVTRARASERCDSRADFRDACPVCYPFLSSNWRIDRSSAVVVTSLSSKHAVFPHPFPFLRSIFPFSFWEGNNEGEIKKKRHSFPPCYSFFFSPFLPVGRESEEQMVTNLDWYRLIPGI